MKKSEKAARGAAVVLYAAAAAYLVLAFLIIAVAGCGGESPSQSTTTCFVDFAGSSGEVPCNVQATHGEGGLDINVEAVGRLFQAHLPQYPWPDLPPSGEETPAIINVVPIPDECYMDDDIVVVHHSSGLSRLKTVEIIGTLLCPNDYPSPLYVLVENVLIK